MMKKLIALLLTLCLALGCTSALATSTFDTLQQMLRGGDGSSTDVAAETAAPAETVAPPEEEPGLVKVDASNNLRVTDVNVIMSTEDYSSYIDCYLYAIISNDGDSNIAVDGMIVVKDAEGNELEEQSYIMPSPAVLEPGATAVLAESMLIAKTDSVTLPEHIASIELSVMKDKYGDDSRTPTYTSCEVTYGSGVDRYGDEVDGVASFTVTNNTGADLYNPTVLAALYDTNDKLICIISDQLGLFSSVRIPDGNTVIIDSALNYYVIDWMTANNVTPASIQCLAYGE